MTRLGLRERLLAVALAGVAGFVDAIGYGQSGGFFVSFMSGNSTRFGVGIAQQASAAATAAALIGSFVAGVVASTLLVRGRTVRARLVLSLVALALAIAACCGAAGLGMIALMCAAFAMGAENAVFEHDGDLQLGLTYMTGTLAKIGQRLAVALRGGDRWLWLPYAIQWIALAGGSVIGALLYPHWGAQLLWAAGAIALLIAGLLARFGSEVRPKKSHPA